MAERYMILPARDPENIRLLRIPDDTQPQETYRLVTGLIAGVEQATSNHTWEDIADVLEEHGFESLEFIRGPELD